MIGLITLGTPVKVAPPPPPPVDFLAGVFPDDKTGEITLGERLTALMKGRN